MASLDIKEYAPIVNGSCPFYAPTFNLRAMGYATPKGFYNPKTKTTYVHSVGTGKYINGGWQNDESSRLQYSISMGDPDAYGGKQTSIYVGRVIKMGTDYGHLVGVYFNNNQGLGDSHQGLGVYVGNSSMRTSTGGSPGAIVNISTGRVKDRVVGVLQSEDNAVSSPMRRYSLLANGTRYDAHYSSSVSYYWGNSYLGIGTSSSNTVFQLDFFAVFYTTFSDGQWESLVNNPYQMLVPLSAPKTIAAPSPYISGARIRDRWAGLGRRY